MLFGKLKRIFRNAGNSALTAVLQTRAFITYEDDEVPFCKLIDLILAFELGMKVLVELRAGKELNGHRLDHLLNLFLDSTSAALPDEKKSIIELCSQYKNAQIPSLASLRYGRFMKNQQFLEPKDLVLKPLENCCLALTRNLYKLIDNVVSESEAELESGYDITDVPVEKITL